MWGMFSSKSIFGFLISFTMDWWSAETGWQWRHLLVLSTFSVSAAMLWVYIVRCKRNKITRARQKPCLLTSALGTTKINKNHVKTMFSIPTTWSRNAVTIEVVEIMTSPLHMCMFCYSRSLSDLKTTELKTKTKTNENKAEATVYNSQLPYAQRQLTTFTRCASIRTIEFRSQGQVVVKTRFYLPHSYSI